MALTPSEERAMREIEHQLEVNDPKFVERLQGIFVGRSPHWILGLIILAVSISFAVSADGSPGPQLVAGAGFVGAGWLFGRTGWHGLLLTAVRMRGHTHRVWAGCATAARRIVGSKPIHRLRVHRQHGRSDRT